MAQVLSFEQWKAEEEKYGRLAGLTPD